MNLHLIDYESKAKEAIKAFWGNRETARKKQIKKGHADQGERAGVTTGKNMDGFLALLKDIVRENGLVNAEICLKRRVLTLPGFFRPTKLWDMLVINKNRLVAAIELKSQVGPSFGNNFNNRTEEAIGTAVDFWKAYREGAFGDQPRPFIGWLMLLEECDASNIIVRSQSPHFPVLKEFNHTSYANRYDILCKKLIQEQLYTATTLLISPRSVVDTGNFTHLSDMTSLKAFISILAGHIASEAAQEYNTHE